MVDLDRPSLRMVTVEWVPGREQGMTEQIPPTRRMRICALPGLANVFLVLMGDSEPGSVPVIPTPLAEGYWSLHSRLDATAS
jgi:hypothetical protein